MSEPAWVGADLSHIQVLTDELAHTIGRSVAIDNASLELLYASAQIGPIDETRVSAIVYRIPDSRPVTWLLSHDIQSARGPVRIPVNNELGMLPRVCFPVRQETTLLGYLWLFDEPVVTADELVRAQDTVGRLAKLLHRQDAGIATRAADLARATREALTSASSMVAVDDATTRGYLPGEGRLTVYLIAISAGSGERGALPFAHTDLQDQVARIQMKRPFLVECSPHEATVVARNRTSEDAAEVASTMRRMLRFTGREIVAAGAAEASEPQELATAHRRAEFAAAIHRLLVPPDVLFAWEKLGAWSLLYGHSLDESTVRQISRDAGVLIARGTPEQQATIMIYLDCARSVTRTCAALSIHRATLYYRLERIRELLGPETLNDGWQTTAMHVALRLHAALGRIASP